MTQQSPAKVGCSRRKTVKRGKGTSGTLPRDATEHFVCTVHTVKHYPLPSLRPPIGSMPVRLASASVRHNTLREYQGSNVQARLASSQLCSQLSAGVTLPSRAVKKTGLSGWLMRVAHVPCGDHSSRMGQTAVLGGFKIRGSSVLAQVRQQCSALRSQRVVGAFPDGKEIRGSKAFV